MSFFQRLFTRHSKSSVASAETDRGARLEVANIVSTVSDERRYREDVPYALPKDLVEGERLNLQHYLFRYVLKGNYAAPIDKTVSVILDVGSGTGIWGQDIAREFPRARIIGLDLESPQSTSLSSSVVVPPANYQFVQGNILEGLPFADNSFDFAHQRMLALALPASVWPNALHELVRVTRPGGWIELLEIGATINNAGPASTQLLQWVQSFLAQRGIEPKLMEQLELVASQAGFKRVQSRYLDLPVGSWDKHIGVLLEKDCLAAYGTLKTSICTALQIAPDNYERVLRSVPEEWKHNHATYRFVLVYGQA